MTDGRIGRLSTTVAAQPDGDARIGRQGVTVATQTDSDARIGRVSVTYAVLIPLSTGAHGGWGIIPIR
jgi:hypothetical protein